MRWSSIAGCTLAVAAALAVLTFVRPEDTSAQTGQAFRGETPEGVSIRFTLSTQWDMLTKMGMGGWTFDVPGCEDFFVSDLGFLSEPVPVTDGTFQVFATSPVAEPPPTYEFTVSGAILSETKAEGTARIRVLENTECDTGVLAWTATAPEPTPEPTPPADLPAGGGPSPVGGRSPLLVALGAGALLAGALLLGTGGLYAVRMWRG